MQLLRMHSNPVEHDYTKSYWGHALHNPKIEHGVNKPSIWRWICGDRAEEYSYLTCLGHGSVREGDTGMLEMQSGKIARFVVIEIDNLMNPDDMFEIKRADFVEFKDGE